MPSRKFHLNFDNFLRAEGVLRSVGDTNPVHEFLDSGWEDEGKEHRKKCLNHSIKAVKDWAKGLLKQKKIDQQECRSYLISAHGHLILDEVSSEEMKVSGFSYEKWIEEVWNIIYKDCYLILNEKGIFKKPFSKSLKSER